MSTKLFLCTSLILCFLLNYVVIEAKRGLRGECVLFEPFNELKLRSDGGYFWILNYGYNSTTQDRDVFESFTGPGSSVILMNNDFARMSLFPNNEPTGFFYAAEISEFNAKITIAGTHGRWFPENGGKSVMITGKVRFSPNINLNGSGPVVGSAGIWLYNLPYSYELDQYVIPPQAFGIQWTSDKNDSPFPGFSVVVYDNDFFPYFLETPKHLNTLSNWFHYRILWSKAGNKDRFTFWINSEYMGSYLSSAGFQPLGYEIWVDNQTIDETGDIELAQANSTQYLDIDFLKTAKLLSNNCPRVAP